MIRFARGVRRRSSASFILVYLESDQCQNFKVSDLPSAMCGSHKSDHITTRLHQDCFTQCRNNHSWSQVLFGFRYLSKSYFQKELLLLSHPEATINFGLEIILTVKVYQWFMANYLVLLWGETHYNDLFGYFCVGFNCQT